MPIHLQGNRKNLRIYTGQYMLSQKGVSEETKGKFNSSCISFYMVLLLNSINNFGGRKEALINITNRKILKV